MFSVCCPCFEKKTEVKEEKKTSLASSSVGASKEDKDIYNPFAEKNTAKVSKPNDMINPFDPEYIAF
jgi:hypothetical protein